jgi:hypothetical protein
MVAAPPHASTSRRSISSAWATASTSLADSAPGPVFARGAAGDGVGELCVEIVDQRLEHLAMRGRHLAPGEHLTGRLVAPHLHDVGLDTQLLQGVE